MLSRTFDEQLEKSKTSFWDAKESKFENEPKQMYSLQNEVSFYDIVLLRKG